MTERTRRRLGRATGIGTGVALSVGLGVAGTAAVIRARRRAQLAPLRGQVAVVIGGTRGLGLALARELGSAGCKVAICGRDDDTLERAREDLLARGVEVVAAACDASDEVDATRFLDRVRASFGPIDVLITVAATIRVGPVETMSVRDFQQAMDSIFWSSVHPTLAVLPSMQRRKRGHIAHVTSIGGRIAVPHLLPYSAAKFAEIGFSEGLRAEVAKDGITVTTIVPWLMRTGSHLHARFAGQSEAEYTWFGLSAGSRLAVDPDRAARRIVGAIARNERQIVLGLAAKLAIRLHALWPSLTSRALELAARMLPSPPDDESGDIDREGIDIAARTERGITRAAERMAHDRALRYHQT